MILLRKFQKSDISLIMKWFKKDHVRQYWYSILTMSEKEIREKYLKRLNKENIEMFIIQKNAQDIGYIQTYFLDNVENYQIEGLSKGIDLFIGEEKFLNQGFGTLAIKRLLNNYVFDDECIINACIDPEVKNNRAIRVYEKIGFKHVKTAVDDISGLLTYYMILERKDFFVI